MIELHALNRAEAVRYLGDASVEMNASMEALLDECEKEVLANAEPKYLTRVIDLPCPQLEEGNDIREHLKGCDKALLMCCTLGNGVDRMLRRAQVTDMAKAVVLDVLASVAVEQACNQVDHIVQELYPERYFTFRFSPGYGDFPLELQNWFLTELNAPKLIGLTTSASLLLTPTKSGTAVAGMSREPIAKKHRGCETCNAREHCPFRKVGTHCGGS